MEKELLAALDSGQLRGACLDVFRREPVPADNPFWRTQNYSDAPLFMHDRTDICCTSDR